MPERERTNAARLLAARGVGFTLVRYRVDEERLDAASAARALAVEPERVLKTLVARSDRGDVFVFCVPGPMELDRRKAARAVDRKAIDLVHAGELRALTGYVRGSCSPIGMKRSYPVVIEESAMLFESVYVSAGARGLQIAIAPRALAAVCRAKVADIAS